MTDVAVLPLLPSLAALGVMAYTLFLAATALGTHRFRKQRSGNTLRETAHAAMFGLGWVGSSLPVLLASLPAFPVPLSDMGWGLALAAAWLLPRLADRRIDLLWRIALSGCVLGIIAAGAVSAWGLPLVSAGALLLVRARLESDLRRSICLASGLLFLLAGITSHLQHVFLGPLLQALVLAALIVHFWWRAGLSRRLLVQLVVSLLLFPVLLAVSGRIIAGNETAFRAGVLQDAYARLELTKSRIDTMNKHGFDLLRVATADPIALEAVLRPMQSHDLQFRILNRRIGADLTFLLDTRGQVIATSDPALKGRNFDYRPYFQAAMRGDASQYLARGALSNLPRVYYARPILNEAADIAAVMVGGFNLSSLIGDSVRMDEVILHQQGVILYGPEPYAHGALFPPRESAESLAKERLFGPTDFAHLGFQKIDEQWVRDAGGRFWLWASVPLPNGVWELSKMVSIASLLNFREDQLFLAMLVTCITLLLAIHYLQSNTLVAQLLTEVDKRRRAEEGERMVRREVELQRDHLDETVRARTHDLAVAKDAAEAGSRAKSEFLATMSHEIRTPMNGILGMTELLRQTALSAQQQRYADAVHQSGEHLLSIINDILDFSKIEAGKLDIEHVDFNLRQLVEDIGYLFAQPAEAKGLDLVCSVPENGSFDVGGDPVRVRQILTNLVSNAVKFTSRGEVTIRAMLLDETQEQARFRFEVQDSGIGVSEEAQARLFSPFVQADSSTTRRFGGSGLGLAIAKRLVEMMGGQIGLRSEAGRGTLFWFELPLRKQDPVKRSLLDRSQQAPTADGVALSAAAIVPTRLGGRVLVAEDNPVNQAVAGAMLESLGVAYCFADNGQIALDRVLQESFDVVLMDCQMPELDGFEASAQIRVRQREGQLPGKLPIIALTANAVEGDRERCLAAGMDDYLSKPFTRERLAATLQRWLPPADAASTSSAPAAPDAPGFVRAHEAAADEAPINPHALDAIRHLPGPNGALLVQKVIGAYLADTPPRFAQLRAAAEAGDAEALRKIAHTLKSSSANVGAESLAALCKALEMLGRQGTLDGAEALLMRAESQLPCVLATLQDMLDRSSDHTIGEIDVSTGAVISAIGNISEAI